MIKITSYGGRSTTTGQRELVGHVEMDMADITAAPSDPAAKARVKAAFTAAIEADKAQATLTTVVEYDGRTHTINRGVLDLGGGREIAHALREISAGAAVQTADDIVRLILDRPEVDRARSWQDRVYINLTGATRATRSKIWVDGRGLHVRLADGEDEFAAAAAALTAWVDQTDDLVRLGPWEGTRLPLAIREVPAGSEVRW